MAKKSTAKFVALKHKHMPGARVMSAAVYAEHLKNNAEGSVFELIGEANTKDAALKLCHATVKETASEETTVEN